ncbi:MAG: hypothetical protein SF028_08790 [Candidatus Sumerlaeia bacterium]|nr:hypothetical protein [Candidatus Sumerlaeia bacterium]
MPKPPPPPPTPEETSRAALRQIRNDVSNILCAWDPLGMKGLRDWRKEYDPYVGPLAVMVKKRVPEFDLLTHLADLYVREWRFAPNQTVCREMAGKLWRAGAFLDNQRANPPAVPES